MSDDTLTISATEFKAKCLAIFDQLERRQVAKVVITRRGKPVAELRSPPAESPAPLWESLRGSVIVAPGVDLTEPASDEIWDAERGILHN